MVRCVRLDRMLDDYSKEWTVRSAPLIVMRVPHGKRSLCRSTQLVWFSAKHTSQIRFECM